MRHLMQCTAVALLIGCTGSDALLTDQGTGDHAGPALDRAGVLRTSVGFGITEPGNPLLVLVGFEEGVTIADWCSGLQPLSLNSIAHIVFPPSGAFLLASHGQDVPILAYETEGDPCDGEGESLVAFGTGRFHFSLSGLTNGRTIANSGVRARLELISGGQALLAVKSPFYALPDGSVKFDKTRIRLTPL